MPDTVLSGRWRVYYSAENRQKRIERDTSVTPTTIDTVNQLYSALQDLFDELTQMDDGTPMSAQTPTEYTIGIIDAGDKDPWFIDRTSVEYLKGGSLKTASWDRVTGTNTGIVRIAYTIGTDFDVTDIGRDIKHTDLDIGTILDFNTTGSTKYVWVRPNDDTATHNFDSAAGTLTVQNDSISQVQRFDDSLATFGTDETADANSAANADWTIFTDAGAALNDYVAIGFSQKFRKVIFDNLNGTAGTVGVVLWEFWNGSTWADLEAVAGFTDGTSDFKAAAADGQTLSWTGTPTGWATTSLNGSPQLYYIRARITTAYTVAPVYDQGFIGATGSVTQSGASVSAGESLWANIYSIGTLEANTHLYIYQNAANLVAYKATTDWWGDGHIDLLVNVKELGTETDEAVIKVYARQYSKTYSYYSVDLTAGGRNPIPLQTGNDLDNQTGYWQIVGSGATGTFVVGETISKSGTDKKGKITAVTGSPGTTPTITYYQVGDPLTNFVNGDTAVTGDTSGATTTIATGPTANGPSALATPPTITFGGLATGGTNDIDENGTAENYSITLDCNGASAGNRLTAVYEWTKYVTRRGSTADIDSGARTIEGQFYIGSETRIIYTTLGGAGTIDDGEVVTGATSGAVGTVVNHNTTDKIIILRDSRGTFTQGEQIDQGTTNVTGTTISSITPITSAPLGTFAGGKFFVAPGVVLTDVHADDANNYQLTDDNNAVIKAPTKVTIKVDNTKQNDKVAVFRLTGALGTIKKTTYTATVQAAGVTTVLVAEAIATDEPGKTSPGGVLRLVDTSASLEYRIRFSSWSVSTFTLASATLTPEAGTNSTTVVDTAAFTTALVSVGDLIYNVTKNAVAYVTSRDNDNQVTISPAITDQVSTNDIRKNVLPVATTTSDTVYVPMIDSFETADGSETATVTFSANIPVLVRARRTGPTNPILPFEQESTVTSTGMTVSIIRTSDTIFVQQ